MPLSSELVKGLSPSTFCSGFKMALAPLTINFQNNYLSFRFFFLYEIEFSDCCSNSEPCARETGSAVRNEGGFLSQTHKKKRKTPSGRSSKGFPFRSTNTRQAPQKYARTHTSRRFRIEREAGRAVGFSSTAPTQRTKIVSFHRIVSGPR